MNASTITLLLYIFLLVPLMLLGYYFARRKMYIPHHKLVMTLIVILNWVLIAVVMIVSYLPIASNLSDSLNSIQSLIATIHGSVGLIAQLLATYLVLLMWTEGTRFRYIVIYRIKNIKTPMRITLSLWIITVLLGFGVYGVWYGDDNSTNDNTPQPASTEEVTISPENTEAVIESAITEDMEVTETVIAPNTTEEAETTETAIPPSNTEEIQAIETITPQPASTEEVISAPEPAITEQPAPPAVTEDIRATEDAIEEATDIAEDLYDDMTDIADDMTDDAEDLYDDMTDDAEDRYDDD